MLARLYLNVVSVGRLLLLLDAENSWGEGKLACKGCQGVARRTWFSVCLVLVSFEAPTNGDFKEPRKRRAITD